MDAHPAAALFPMLPDTELAVMGRDIVEHGQQHPVIVWRGLILDGRNRTRACELVGRSPETKDMSDLSERDAIHLVISSNIHRRHLTESQRAMIASELAKLPHGVNKGKEDAPIGASCLSQDEAADAMQVGRRSVQRARQVQEQAPDLAAKVKAGEMKVSKAAAIARDRAAPKTDPDLADDSVVDATDQRHAEGDTAKARAVLAAVARLDDTELSFIKPDLLKILGVV